MGSDYEASDIIGAINDKIPMTPQNKVNRRMKVGQIKAKHASISSGLGRDVFTPQQEDETLDINVHTDDHDLDMDRAAHSPAKKAKTGKTIIEEVKKTLRKQKLTIAKQLLKWPTPATGRMQKQKTMHKTMPTPYVLDTADRENKAEIQMLAHA